MKHGLQAMAWFAVSLAAGPVGAAASVGSPAPGVEPTEWINTKGSLSWKDLKGRVILLEKWATW